MDAASIRRCADAFRDRGLESGEPVAVWAESGKEAAETLLGLQVAGACVVPIHPRLTLVEADELLCRVGARWVVTDSTHEGLTNQELVQARLPPRGTDWSLPRTPPVRRTVAEWILFTSGTSGTPKGVLLSDKGFVDHARAVKRRLGLQDGNVWAASLSFAHVGGLAMLLRCRDAGQRLSFSNEEARGDWDSVIEGEGVALLSLVPTQLRRWLAARRGPMPGGLRTVLVGGAPCPADLLERARLDGLPVRLTYGLTEASSQVATATASSPEGSPGAPLDGIEVRIRDDEIQVRGSPCFLGYLDDEAASKAARDGGWVRTRDRGRIDDAGNLWVLGRSDDVVITGGENVDPAEVESVLSQHPSVIDAVVFGLESKEWGEEVVAFVLPRPGPLLDLRPWLRERLAAFKVPKEIRFVQDLPRTANGKVLRAKAKAQWRGSSVRVARTGDHA